VDQGVSAIWLLANICYASMKAQAHPSGGWRVFSFVFGMPGTFLSLLVVKEGSGELMASIYRNVETGSDAF
jgi:hypothetical protein